MRDKKRGGSRWEGKWEGTRNSRRRDNCNQNMLNEEKLFSIKRKITQQWELILSIQN